MRSSGISLADKCQLLFGGAVVLILAAALVVPWLRVEAIVDAAQLEASRQAARLWSSQNPGRTTEQIVSSSPPGVSAGSQPTGPGGAPARHSEVQVHFYPQWAWEGEGVKDADAPFLARARKTFDQAKLEQESTLEAFEGRWDGGERVYQYATVIHNDSGQRAGVVLVVRRSEGAQGLLLRNRLYLIGSALGAGVLAVLVFYIITTRIILSPVRQLRDTAEMVRAGNLGIRSGIETGDEFEELSDAFNSMLGDLEQQQQQMRAINKTLDLKLTELAERNLSLYEAARLKGEFLASVSHELRTPLNSIIGFAEILRDGVEQEQQAPEKASDSDRIARRLRYLSNIVSAGRTLLEMINDLLAMARIEAGNIDVHVQEVSVGATCEGLVALIKPLADRKSLKLNVQLASGGGGGFVSDPAKSDLPAVKTDPKKFEQIVFNFLSNAVKFTPEGGEVTLRAERLKGSDGVPRLRVSVLDTGPGIPASQHAFVFERFTQIDSSRTREHQGTGLGLAIAKEFAELLQGEIQLVSEVGRGSMFSLILPMELNESLAKEAATKLVGRVRERGGQAGNAEPGAAAGQPDPGRRF